MILGIASPVGGREDSQILLLRLRMWLAHLTGGAIGGAAMGCLVWILASPIRTFPPRLVGVILFAAAGLVFAVWDLAKFHLPFSGQQVPARWASAHGAVQGYAMYGIYLGTGLLTFVPVGATYVLFSGLALITSFGTAAIAGALFGVARTGLIGPAALAADSISRLLFRSRLSHAVFPRVSAASSIVIVAVVAAHLLD